MESSIGRLLIIKTSINQINTVIIKPIGFGEFANWYLPHQSKYLNKIEKINSDFLLADNSEFAFNDFLQVFIEMGFIGLGIFIAIFILAFKYNSYFKPKYNFRNFLWYYILISCFCYILYVDLFKFIFISIIAYISSHQNKSILRIQSNKMILFKCILIPLIIFNLFWHYNPNFRLHEKSTRLIIHPEHNVYDEAYKLYTKQKYNDAIYLLSNIELCSFDMDLLLLKAKCYEEIFDVINAQNYYIKAYELFPNKFKPKYHLFQFLKSKQFDARSIAKDILDTPIKIDNRETQSLRKEAIEYLNNNGTNSINVEHPIG
ncbi:hypothetical protein AB3466_22255 [Sphingobacterium thalpophilum]|uniref:hypothetical protein n=1 Tax=Sphingobacterium thalpophilum TaxID=259 RepID=UPI0037DA03D3